MKQKRLKKLKLKKLAEAFYKLEISDDPQRVEKMSELVEKFNLSLGDMLEIDEYIQDLFDKK